MKAYVESRRGFSLLRSESSAGIALQCFLPPLGLDLPSS